MTHVYILTKLSLNGSGNVESKNVGVTFNLHEAEAHKAKGVENDFEGFSIDADWQADAATTDLVLALRAFREIVDIQIEEALK